MTLKKALDAAQRYADLYGKPCFVSNTGTHDNLDAVPKHDQGFYLILSTNGSTRDVYTVVPNNA